MKTKIFYFSGTGNSLFIAKKLQEKIEDSELVPIIDAQKGRDRKVKADTVILVFPVYALTLPLPVRKFLRKFNFRDVAYFSAMATRLGVRFNDFQRIERYIRPKTLDSHFILNMGSNDIKIKDYRCPSIHEIKELESAALKEVDRAVGIIRSGKHEKRNDIAYLEPLPLGDARDRFVWWLIPKLMTFSRLIGGVNYFYINSKCNGCGICSKVCLSGKIIMEDKKPVWNRKTLCHMCYACVNFCPAKAIEIASIPGVPSYSHENGRYSHPYAKVEDMQTQKG